MPQSPNGIRQSKSHGLENPLGWERHTNLEEDPLERQKPNQALHNIDTDLSSQALSPPPQIYPRPGEKPRHVSRSYIPVSFGQKSQDQGKIIPAPLSLQRELSPNDCFIPIVLSKPDSTSTPDLKKQPSSQSTQDPTERPDIVITPNEQRLNSSLVPLQHPRPKAPSSVYSKIVSSIERLKPYQSPPPLPRPSISRGASNCPYTAGTRKRGFSDVTIFEEDTPSLNSRPSKLSPPPGGRCRSISSLETVLPTPRRSRGWWNFITSPFLNHSGSLHEESLQTLERGVPDLSTRQLSAPTSSASTLPDQKDLTSNKPAQSPRTKAFEDQFYETPEYGEAAKYYFPERYCSGVPGHGTIPDENVGRADRKGTTPVEWSIRTDSQDPEKVPDHLHVEETPKEENRTRTTAAVTENARSIPVHENHPQETNQPPAPSFEHRAVNSPDTPLTSASPVLGIADIRRFQSAHSVEATRPPKKSPNIEPRAMEARQEVVKKDPSPGAKSHRAFIQDASHSESKNDSEKQPAWTRHREAFTTRSPPALVVPRQLPPRPKREMRKGSWFWNIAAGILSCIIVIAIALSMTVTHSYRDMQVQSQFLNLTSFPPLQTGISTIVQSDTKVEVTGCVSSNGLWNCLPPAENPNSIAPAAGSQPNFRLEIRYRKPAVLNAIAPNSTINNSSSMSFAPQGSSRKVSYRSYLKARDTFANMIYSAYPVPPSLNDQKFLGNTTDNVTTPFQGENTPFVVSFLPAQPLVQHKSSKRQASANDSSTTEKVTQNIPAPRIDSAAPANLYPFPEAQPIKLFNRGRDDEHYGFYSYFDRSVLMHLSDAKFSSGSATATASNPNALCTWSETRFFVQIWTRFDFSRGSAGSSLVQNLADNSNSSANDFRSPGSFGLPVTVTIDRHGGDPGKKGVYCYGLDNHNEPIRDAKFIVKEDRAFAGSIVNAAPGPFVGSSKAGDFGGFDGGTGGCRCVWDNF